MGNDVIDAAGSRTGRGFLRDFGVLSAIRLV